MRTLTFIYLLCLFNLSFSETNWKLYATPYTESLLMNKVVRSGNYFYGIRGKTLSTSVDGEDWNYLINDTSYIQDIYADGNRLFLIYSDGRTLISSNSGMTWRSGGGLPPISNSSYRYSNSIIFKDIKIAFSRTNLCISDFNDSSMQEIALGTLSFSAATDDMLLVGNMDTIYYTIDGYNWNKKILPTYGKINATKSYFIFTPGHHEFDDSVYISHDANEWINVTDSAQYNSLVRLERLTQLDDGSWFGLKGNGTNIISTDGNEWELSYFGISSWYSTKYLITKDDFIMVAKSYTLYLSHDKGQTWNEVTSDIQSSIYSIGSAGNIGLIGLKYEGLTTSKDNGRTWQKKVIKDPNNPSFEIDVPGHDIAVGDGKIVTVGGSGRWAQSTDCESWVYNQENYLIQNSSGSSLSWSGSFFTWFGRNYYPLKLEGDSWIPCTTETLVNTVCHVWGNGTMVAVGYSDTILVGEEMNNLEVHKLSQDIISLDAVHHNGEYFTAVGIDGTIISSPNGRNWTKASSVPTANRLKGICWTGNCWYAVGDGGTVLKSLDALHWTKDEFPEYDDLNSIGICGTKLFIGGGKLYFKEVSTTPISSSKNYLKKSNLVEISLKGDNLKINVPYDGMLKVRMIDIKGREIAVFHNTKTTAGNLLIPWKNKRYASNLYFLDIKGEQFEIQKRIISLK